MSQFKNLILETFNELVLAEENKYTTANEAYLIENIFSELTKEMIDKGYEYFEENLFNEKHGAYYPCEFVIGQNPYIYDIVDTENDRKTWIDPSTRVCVWFYIFGHINPNSCKVNGEYSYVEKDQLLKLQIAIWLGYNKDTKQQDINGYKHKSAYRKALNRYTITNDYLQITSNDVSYENLVIKHEIGHLLDDIKRNFKQHAHNKNYGSKNNKKHTIAWYLTWDELEQIYREVVLQIKNYFYSHKDIKPLIYMHKEIKNARNHNEIVDALRPCLHKKTIYKLRTAFRILYKNDKSLYNKFMSRLINFFNNPMY